MHDEGEGEPIVGDVLRTGYALNGRVVRPAMVKVTRTGEDRAGEASE
jgi:molecular chaperone GrpE (heat shock protein)